MCEKCHSKKDRCSKKCDKKCKKCYIRGCRGPTGQQGPTGAQGPTGPQGLEGPTGPQGLEGPTGPQGLEGPTGQQGLEGLTGAQGPTGDQGPAGLQGPTGPSGQLVGFSAALEGPSGTTGNQNISNGGVNEIIFNNDLTEPFYDIPGNYDSGNGIFTVPITGTYNITAALSVNINGSSEITGQLYIYINHVNANTFETKNINVLTNNITGFTPYLFNYNSSINLLLNQGDKIKIVVESDGSGLLSGFVRGKFIKQFDANMVPYYPSTFSASLIAEL